MSETLYWHVLMNYRSFIKAFHQMRFYWNHLSRENSYCYGNTTHSGLHFYFARSCICPVKHTVSYKRIPLAPKHRKPREALDWHSLICYHRGTLIIPPFAG